MAIKIRFDVVHNPEEPTIILAKRSGDKLGQINARSIEVTDNLNEASEISFSVYKYADGKEDYLWDKITNFKLVYCPEWDSWFEITVELNESDDTVKTVFGKSLGQAELSQIMLYDIEINTENDILRDDYDENYPTILYRNDMPKASLLHRIMEKAPHYSIAEVDDTLRSLSKVPEFTFSDISLYDAFQEIAEEYNCIFIFKAFIDDDGVFRRTISLYDLESNCLNSDCKYRGEFTLVCPECGCTDVKEGYGEDTTIFVTSDELADEIQLTYDTDATKNCFKLEAGDDLMTSAIRSCNPNGTDYIWYIPNYMKEDMSEELVTRLEEYDDIYREYQKDYKFVLDGSLLDKYNEMVKRYCEYNDKLEEIHIKVDEGSSDKYLEGYPSLINAYYNTFDLYLFLQSALMPTVNISSETTAVDEAKKLLEDDKNISGSFTADSYSDALSPVAMTNNSDFDEDKRLLGLSVSTANSTVLSVAKVVVDPRYKVKISSSSLNVDADGNDEVLEDANGKYRIWYGNISISSYSDDEDSTTTDDVYKEVHGVETANNIKVRITVDAETYVRKKIEKALADEDGKVEDMSISGVFARKYNETHDTGDCDDDCFQCELKNYSLHRLQSFHDACQACVDILIEQGIADREGWGGEELYNELYLQYVNKLKAIDDEMKVREEEMALIAGVFDENGDLITYGLRNHIEEAISNVQNALDFEAYIGQDYYKDNVVVRTGDSIWIEFCSFRREDKYSNDTYISDGFNNAELIDRAKQFIEIANKEIRKSAELQKSISTSLKNLLVIPKFNSLVNHFGVGNWIRVMIDDKLYKLRMISYTIDYSDLSNISVDFSDAIDAKSSSTLIQDVLEQASSMATSYSSVRRQASQGSESNTRLVDWVENGLSLTKMKIVDNADNQNVVWDEHGILCREYLPETDAYDDRQLKIINRGLYITNDNWTTSKAGIGNFIFHNPRTGQTEEGYGVIANTLVGDLILSEDVGVYTKNNSITLNENGVVITVDKDVNNAQNAFTVKSVKTRSEDGEVKKVETTLLNVDAEGRLELNGAASIRTAGNGYEFSDNGLFITKLNSDKSNQLTEEGMTIYRGDSAILTADDEGVVAEDLHAKTYLIIGKNSRFEDYENNNEYRTGCFWIGD